MVPRVSTISPFISSPASVAESVWAGRPISCKMSVFVFGLVRALYTFCSLSVRVCRSSVCWAICSSPRSSTISCPLLMQCAPSRRRALVPAPVSENMLCGTAPTSLL